MDILHLRCMHDRPAADLAVRGAANTPNVTCTSYYVKAGEVKYLPHLAEGRYQRSCQRTSISQELPKKAQIGASCVGH